MMCLLVKFTCIISQIYIFSHNWRENLQVITTLLDCLDFFIFLEGFFSIQQYVDTVVQFFCLLPSHQQWLVCIQSTHQHLTNKFKLQLHYRKTKIDKHIPLAERQPSHLCFRVWKIIICAGVFTCYWNFPASNKEFCNCWNEGMMVQFLWLSGFHVALWKFSQKQKDTESQIKPKTLIKSSVKCLPL